jgi:ribose-phosphate pyrophosphokinase
MYLLIPELGSTKRLDVLFSVFPDGDIHCVVPESRQLIGNPVLVVAHLYPDQNTQLMRLALLLDLLKSIGATKISVFCPYLPYSRQDKRHIEGEAVSADTICTLLANMGCTCLYTLDCHFMKGKTTEARGGLRIYNFSLGGELVRACQKLLGNAPFEVLGPDKGSRYLVQELGAQYMLKQRSGYDGLSNGDSYRTVAEIEDSHIILNGKPVILLDDMISTGSTLVQSIAKLRQRGVKRIYCAATHGLFLRDSYQTLSNLADGLIFSDSIPQSKATAMVDDILDGKIIPSWLETAK